MSTITKIFLTIFAAFALIFVGAAPALADHNAGADLDEGGDCYYGTMLPGGPNRIQCLSIHGWRRRVCCGGSRRD